MATKNIQFKPMLAAREQINTRQLQYPVLASAKLDGIRCVIHNGRALSRSLKPIPNKHIRFQIESLGLGAEGFDGEIMLPYPATFQQVSSAVMSQEAEPPNDWFWAVFDRVPLTEREREKPFIQRIDEVRETIRWAQAKYSHTSWASHVQFLEHRVVTSVSDLMSFERQQLKLGHEGVMIRSYAGPYKFGRSTVREGHLLKMKRFTDGEAVIYGMEELYHNENEAFVGELGQTKRQGLQENLVPGNMMGNMLVIDRVTGKRFAIGTGFTLRQKKAWWKLRKKMIGVVVKYKFQEHGVKDKPRIPVFVGFRDAKDT